MPAPSPRLDSPALEARLRRIADELWISACRPEVVEAAGEAALAELKSGLERPLERTRRPFHVLVIGDFKRGKSTLVNAICGAELVIMDVAPETVAITELSWGPALEVQVVMQSGALLPIAPEDLPSARLARLLENLPSPVDVLRIRAPQPALEGLLLVDSPGMGDLLWRFDRRVLDYLPRADAVLYVVSALSPLSDTERSFLSSSLRPLELSRVAVVVNQLDCLGASDADRVLARVREQLQPTFPRAPVFGLSALHSLMVALGEAPPAPGRAEALDQGMEGLREHIGRLLLLDRDLVRGERACQEGEEACLQASQGLRRVRQHLEQDRTALARRRAGLEQRREEQARELRRHLAELEAELGAMGEEAAGWMGGLVDRLEAEVLPALAGMEHARVQRHFPFFLTALLRDGLTACMESHHDRLLDRVERSSAELALQLSDELEDRPAAEADPAGQRAGFVVPGWTFFDQVHVVSALLGLFTGMVAPLVAGLLDRSLAQEERAQAYRARLVEGLPGLRAEVRAAARQAYQRLHADIAARVAERQAEEVERAGRELDQAARIQDRGLEAAGRAHSALGLLLERVEQARARYAALRAELGAMDGA